MPEPMPEVQETPAPEAAGWEEADWETLIEEIRHKQCTPFLGAGASAKVLPLGREIARAWAEKYGYPFPDRENLARVAQYVAIERGPRFPKFKIIDAFRELAPPDFTDLNEPHRVVADLRLPIYITTNYDNYMFQALERGTPTRHPRREICKWHLARRLQSLEPETDLKPSQDGPLVYHLHGILDEVESIVLTEDDYLDFLMLISEERTLLPPCIERAFTESSLLFMGYSLEDLNFKVLFRKLATYMQRNESARHVSVQLAPRTDESTVDQLQRIEKQRNYLAKHFNLQRVKVYWGSCEQFAAELRTHWGG